MGADFEMQEQLDEVFVWKTGHSGREGCGSGWKEFNLIIATLSIPTILLDASERYTDALGERKSVSTETSGLPGLRKLGAPDFPVSYIRPPVRLPFPPRRSSRYPHLPKLTLRAPFEPSKPPTPSSLICLLPCAC